MHLPRALSMAEASDAGANSLEHVEMLVQSALMQQDSATKKLTDQQRIDAAFDALSGERGAALWARLAKNHTWFVPTMVAYERGSDFSDWALVPGVDLHNELALLVESGFSPMEALQAATIRPAEFLGKTADFGTVAVGKVADLVLLDADPLESISHTRKIRDVILGGKYVDVVEMWEAMTLTSRR